MQKNHSLLFGLRTILFTLLISVASTGKSQLAGVYSVPGSFTSIAAANSALNNQGVSGPVIINVAAGYIESTLGGLFLGTISGASAFNTITIKKNGTGANPLVIAPPALIGTPASNTNQDGIWRFGGTDFVTIDGIDLLDTNSANPATMEFGFGFFKGGSANGCQFNTIKNCVITLNRINSASGNGISENGSKGIYFSSSQVAQYGQAANVTSAQGSNSNNKIYNNRIQNCHSGIVIRGYDNQGYTPYSDQKNDIGGLSAVTGNTIINYGGGPGTAEAYGIKAAFQYSLNASHNTIINNNGSGISPSSNLYAVYNQNYNAADVTINSNTIALSSVSTNTSLVLTGIRTIAQSTFMPFSTTPVINLNKNVFSSFSSVNAKCEFFFNSVNTGILNMNQNIIQNVNVVSADINLFRSFQTSTCNVNSNTITGVYTDNCDILGIDLSLVRENNCSDNFFGNITSSTLSPNSIQIFESYAGKVYAINNNTLTNIQAINIAGFRVYSNENNATYTITGNEANNLRSVAGFSTVSNINVISLNNYSGTSNVQISGNTIYSLTCSSAPAFSTNPAGIVAIGTGYITSLNLFGNKLYAFHSYQDNSTCMGINAEGYFTNPSWFFANIYNNVIGDLDVAGTGGHLCGIRVRSSQSSVNFNSIFLNGSFTGPNTASENIQVYHTSSNNIVTTIKNNILFNNTPATGTGSAYCVYFPNMATYGTASDRNLMYIGTPAPGRYYAVIGTNTYPVFANFKSAVSPREVQTFTESTVFTTTNGAMPNTLDLDPNVITLAEGGATPVQGITTDYTGNIRNVNNPDIGAWEGNYTGFDRIAPVVQSAGFTTLPCGNFTGRTFTVHITDSSGVAVGTFAPRLYYKVNSGSYTSVQGILSSGTNTNGVWTFNLVYNTTAGSTISYYLAVQDQTSFNNLSITGTFGGAGTSVIAISTPPSPFTYVLQNYPTISANSGSICKGNVFQINPSGASTYTYSSGTSTVSPATSSSYTVTGTSSSGCPATNTVVVNVTVLPSPTITVNSGSVCYLKPFTIQPLGANSYTYSTGTPVVTPSVNITVTVTGKSFAGCPATNTAIASITVNPLPKLSVTSSNSVLCIGETVSLTAGGALNYKWNTGDNTADITDDPDTTVVYTVTGTDVNGCSSTTTKTLQVSECNSLSASSPDNTIKVFPNPANGILKIIVTGGDNSNPGQTREFQIINILGEVVWSENIDSGNKEVDIRNLANGLYTLRILENGKDVGVRKIVKQ